MQKPSFSVVIPTYNRLDRLKICLPTFLATKLEGIEFIIMDNCSTDGTWSYLNDLSSKDKRIRILQNPQNVGAIKTIFRCYCEVKSPYALFLADDDQLEGDYIELCYNIFTKYPKVGMIHHFAHGWKDLVDKKTSDYNVFQSGDKAQESVATITGSYPGIAFRISCLNLKEFPLADGVIYPQVKISLCVSKKYDVALINNAGVVTPDWGESLSDFFVSQNRPDDFGLRERGNYIKQFASTEVYINFIIGMSEWYFDKLAIIVEERSLKSYQIINSIPLDLVNLYSLFLLIKMRNISLSITLLSYLIIRFDLIFKKVNFVINLLCFKKLLTPFESKDL
jgi:glycosyltransferase involved in cell wall biosynthesis